MAASTNNRTAKAVSHYLPCTFLLLFIIFLAHRKKQRSRLAQAIGQYLGIGIGGLGIALLYHGNGPHFDLE